MIRELYDAAVRASKGWRSRPDGYERMREAWRVYREAVEELRVRLPFPTGVAYAYSPHERATTGSAVHIIVKAPEGIHIGRLKRAFGDALCRPSANFWGLTEKEPGKDLPDCILCAERAERIVAATS